MNTRSGANLLSSASLQRLIDPALSMVREERRWGVSGGV
jgi:hypothetical protein